MKKQNISIVASFFVVVVLLLQAHSDGRATRNRDNTGAPGGQMGGNGMITCSNCHTNGGFDIGLNLELVDSDNNVITEYLPNEIYTARMTINTLSGAAPSGYGFQMVSLIDSDNSDVNGWDDSEISSNVQLIFANSTGRVYAEHNDLSASNEFTARWVAPEANSGPVSFYVAGIGANSNAGSTGDVAPTPIRVTFAESGSTSTTSVSPEVDIEVFPNPTSQYLNVVGDTKNRILEIYNQGHLVKSHRLNNQNERLDLAQLVVGIYFVVIRDLDQGPIVTKKVIKL